jgi:hypothetical protein
MARVFVDWNNNQSFADAGDTVFTSATTTGLNTIGSFNFTVPAGAITGNVRMRIVFTESSTSPTNCGTYTYGETEDYCINILPGCVGPNAPTVSPASASVAFGTQVSFTASGSAGTMNWYNAPTGGSLLFSGSNYVRNICSDITLYVAENNGSCDGPRTAVPVTISTTFTISASVPSFCGTGGSTMLSVSPIDPSITYTWQ